MIIRLIILSCRYFLQMWSNRMVDVSQFALGFSSGMDFGLQFANHLILLSPLVLVFANVERQTAIEYL